MQAVERRKCRRVIGTGFMGGEGARPGRGIQSLTTRTAPVQTDGFEKMTPAFPRTPSEFIVFEGIEQKKSREISRGLQMKWVETFSA
jgi:hypothetical protein